MKMNKISPKQIKWWRKAIGISSLIILIGLMSLYTVDVNEKRDQKLKDLHGDLESLIKEYQMIKDKITMLSQEQSSKETKERKKRSSEPYHTETYTASGGGVYIRWGRMTCPTDNETELVYKGIGGGSHYTHEGGATEVVCLPDQPEWGKYDDASTGYAFMYGMEYEDNMDGILDHSNVQGTLANQNVPCAVCRSKVRPSALMIPGKHSCFDGWKFEYKGYIMAGHYTHKAGSKYICLDEAPEADPAGYRDENGALLYRVEMQCGSAPCPQYVQNRELSCVVCTK